MLTGEIIKAGKVLSIKGRRAEVAVDCGDDACSSCKAAIVCGPRKRLPSVKAVIPEGVSVEIGDEVILAGHMKNWLVSWLLLAGLPVMALLCGVVVGMLLNLRDGAIGAIALGLLVVYYAVLWLMRRKVDRRVVWQIRK